jgi:hypothetical protein
MGHIIFARRSASSGSCPWCGTPAQLPTSCRLRSTSHEDSQPTEICLLTFRPVRCGRGRCPAGDIRERCCDNRRGLLTVSPGRVQNSCPQPTSHIPAMALGSATSCVWDMSSARPAPRPQSNCQSSGRPPPAEPARGWIGPLLALPAQGHRPRM